APIATAPGDGSRNDDYAIPPNPLDLSRIGTGKLPVDGPSVLGIRPEAFSTRDGELHLARVQLDFVEWMGHDVVGHFRLVGRTYSIRLPAGAKCAPGDHIDLFITCQACHLFGAAGDRVN